MTRHDDQRQFRLFLYVLAGCLLFSFAAAYLLKQPRSGESLFADAPGPAVQAGPERRAPAVAGSFYPSDAAALRSLVADLLAAAGGPEDVGRPRIILSPHAGYEYSGTVAAAAFQPLIGSGYTRAVIVGRSHRSAFSGIAADDREVWSTPLGDVGLDRSFIKELAETGAAIRNDAAVHDGEHSLEIMLPFLQVALGPELKIVPLLFGSDDAEAAAGLASALAGTVDDRTVVIVSSDLAHYPAYDLAEVLDGATVDSIVSGQAQAFWAALASREEMARRDGQAETLACGGIAILTALELAARMEWPPRLLKYANSGDVAAGTRDRVVGYAAIGFYPREEPTAGGELDAAAQAEAVGIVREALRASFAREEYSPAAGAPALEQQRGVFVTLKKEGQLRGCIGVFEPGQPLRLSVRDLALAAAFEDRRFRPLEAPELQELEIEVSVLSPLMSVFDPRLIVAGRHGVELSRGRQSGVFLPQVATEQGWDRDAFLSRLCTEKAGLDGACWRDPETRLRVFTAQAFGDRYAQ